MAYMAVAPVYWLPFLSPDILRAIKIAIFSLAAALAWDDRDRSAIAFMLRSSYGVPILCVLLLTSIPGFLLAAPGQLGRTLLDFVLVMVTLWTAYAIANDVERTAWMLKTSAVVLGILAIPTVTNGLLRFPAWPPPAEYNLFSLADAGFGAARTGWSNGLALYVPLLLLPVLQRGGSPWVKAGLLGLLATILSSQYLSAGRAGLVASALAFLLMLVIVPVSGRRRWGVNVTVIFLLALTWMISGSEALMSGDSLAHLRLDRLQGSTATSWSALDAFSAGRLELMRYAIDQFVDRPFGSGFGNAIYAYGTDVSSYRAAEVHNLWLKLLVEAGPFLVVALLAFVVLLLSEIFMSLRRIDALAEDDPAGYRAAYGLQVAYMTVIVQGLFVSMFEPNALIGSFQATALWWITAGAALRNASLARSDLQASRPESFPIGQYRVG